MNKLLKHTKLLTLITSAVLLSSCATIASKNTYDVTIDSNPTHLKFSVSDLRTRNVVATGETPQIVTLNSSVGYFQKAEYQISVTKVDGSKVNYNLFANLSGWYFGNILFGGPIGLLVVDPLTGDMWNLPEKVVVQAGSSANITDNKTIALTFVDINTLTPEQKSRLVVIKPNL